MSHDEQFLDALDRWQTLRDDGHWAEPTSLCEDCPALEPSVSAAIARLSWLDTLLRPLLSTISEPGKELELPTDPFLPCPALPRVPALAGFDFGHQVGYGSFGEVWLAQDIHLLLPRAIKLVPRERASRRAAEGLMAEARKMAQLPKHRHRVMVHGFFPGEQDSFLVMEYVDGGTLGQQVKDRVPIPWQRAVRYVAEVAEGLVDVHAAGMLHRDIKPSNILWDRKRDEALLADYGIAVALAEADGVAGTPGFLAPELAVERATAKADIFSLAATLYTLVVGETPFSSRDPLSSMEQARRGLARPTPALAGLPQALVDLIHGGLDPQPAERPDLPTLIARLRSLHLDSLARRLRDCASRPNSAVRLDVTLQQAREPELVFRPVAWDEHPAAPAKQPLAAEVPTARLHTGDLAQLEVSANLPGSLTVLNFGSSGQIKVLFPNPLAPDPRTHPGQVHRWTFQMTPPAGADRLAVIWSREPANLTAEGWRRRLEGSEAGNPSAVRGMDLVLHETGDPERDEWVSWVARIEHQPAAAS